MFGRLERLEEGRNQNQYGGYTMLLII